MALVMTRHARERWAERFPLLDPETEWAAARRLGRKARRQVRESCPAHEHYTRRSFLGRYLMASPRVVFVMALPEVVITVLDRHGR